MLTGSLLRRERGQAWMTQPFIRDKGTVLVLTRSLTPQDLLEIPLFSNPHISCRVTGCPALSPQDPQLCPLLSPRLAIAPTQPSLNGYLDSLLQDH